MSIPQLPGTLVSSAWLADHLGDEGLRIVDIRGYVRSTPPDSNGFQVASYDDAVDEYDAGHIPGSVYVDWTADIINPGDPVPVQIASPSGFAMAMSDLGIGDDSAVVIADHTGGHFATRLWWALKYYGHDNAAILDGGYEAWNAGNSPLTTDVPPVPAATFTPKPRPALIVDSTGVLSAIGGSESAIIDGRDSKTFSGEVYRGSRRGHIPGALNVPISRFHDEEGKWRSANELRAIFAEFGLSNGERVISYCNGGVTSTAVLFALDRAGHKNYANYDGSWNEWGERLDLPTEASAG